MMTSLFEASLRKCYTFCRNYRSISCHCLNKFKRQISSQVNSLTQGRGIQRIHTATWKYLSNGSCHYTDVNFNGIFCVKESSRTFSTRHRGLPIIYLFTKEGCTLCDQAKSTLAPYSHRFVLEEVDITLPENEPWYEMYKYDIPVFHMFEDFLFKHRVDFDVLEQALKEYEEGNSKK